MKRRVVLSLAFLLLAKLVSVSTPYIYKLAVDSLSNEAGTDPRALIGLGAVGLVVAYGLSRLGAVLFGEKMTRRRLVATSAVLAGLIALRV